jgi:phosphoribosylamine--glycine ligase
MWGRGGVYVFDSSGCGELADQLRKAGELVVGGGGFCDKLEQKRGWAEGLATAGGCKAPKTYPFKTIRDSVKFLESRSGKFYFKTDKDLGAALTYSDEAEYLADYLENYIIPTYGDNISHILQEAMDGIALSTARFWNGRSFVGPYEGTMERKKLLVDDIGPATGCSFNALWYYWDDQPKIAEALRFEKLAETWRREEASPGIYDINALISEDDEEPYFLEFTPRFGYDSEPTGQKGILDYGKFLYLLATAGDGIDKLFDRSKVYGSVRVSVSPYPFEHTGDLDRERHLPIGLPVRGADGYWSKRFIAYGLKDDPTRGICCADPTGILGLVSGAGDDVDLFRGVYTWIEKNLHVQGLQYRPDAEKALSDDLRKIVSLGYDVR